MMPFHKLFAQYIVNVGMPHTGWLGSILVLIPPFLHLFLHKVLNSCIGIFWGENQTRLFLLVVLFNIFWWSQ